MPYKFCIDTISRRRVDGALTGAVITIRCDKTNVGGEVVADSFLTWYADSSDFPNWPPTKAQERAYFVTYLTTPIPGAGYTRAQKMKAQAVVMEDTPETWTEAEKDLPLT